MLLQQATWPEIETYLRTSMGIVVPIGSTEQHGPSGLIGTDALTAEFISKRLGEVTNSLVAPTLNYGMAEHHMAFKGTITLKTSTLANIVHDIVTSLVRHGFKRIFFVNGHGGNVKTVRTAFKEIQNELKRIGLGDQNNYHEPVRDVRLMIQNWWMGEKTTALRKSLYGNLEGYHATPSEIAVTWHALPEQERKIKLEPLQTVNRGYQGPEDYRALFPDGRMGSDPSLANPEDGKKLADAAISDLATAYRVFLHEP